MKLVSACLVGCNTRYDGRSKLSEKVLDLMKRGEILIPVCPEQLGGLSTPRASAGIYKGTGTDVIKGIAAVKTIEKGEDVTKNFVSGANEALRIARLFGIKEAILKQKSPSCGCGVTWQLDDNFQNHTVKGDGVTAALLKKNGIKVITEEDL